MHRFYDNYFFPSRLVADRRRLFLFSLPLFSLPLSLSFDADRRLSPFSPVDFFPLDPFTLSTCCDVIDVVEFCRFNSLVFCRISRLRCDVVLFASSLLLSVEVFRCSPPVESAEVFRCSPPVESVEDFRWTSPGTKMDAFRCMPPLGSVLGGFAPAPAPVMPSPIALLPYIENPTALMLPAPPACWPRSPYALGAALPIPPPYMLPALYAEVPVPPMSPPNTLGMEDSGAPPLAGGGGAVIAFLALESEGSSFVFGGCCCC